MDRADFEDAVLQELRDAQALRAGKREVELSGDAALEEIEMLGAAHARNDEMQVVDDFRIDLRERTRQEIRLLLVVALDDHAVARGDERLQDIDDALGGQHHAIRDRCDARKPAMFFRAARGPAGLGLTLTGHVDSRSGHEASLGSGRGAFNHLGNATVITRVTIGRGASSVPRGAGLWGRSSMMRVFPRGGLAEVHGRTFPAERPFRRPCIDNAPVVQA